jgi:predicted nucleic acid-binding protein
VIVVDASVTTSALIYADDRGRRGRAILGRDTEWAVPQHWMVEVFAAIRGLTIGRKISQEQGGRALGRLQLLGVDEVPIHELLLRMWELRDAVSAYDAPYVSLAEIREITLVTSDSRLAKTATGYCRVELA